MKRLIAAVVDGYIAGMFFIVPGMTARIVFNISPFFVFIIFPFIPYCLYSFIFDYFYGGYTWGKKWMKVNIAFEEKQDKSLFKYALIHSLFKALTYYTWPISVLIYKIYNDKMPYDKMLNVNIE